MKEIEKELEENLKNNKKIFDKLTEENTILKRKVIDLQEIIKIKDFQLEEMKNVLSKKCSINDNCYFTTTEIARLFNISAIRLNRILIEKNILIRGKKNCSLSKKYKNKGLETYKYFTSKNNNIYKEIRWTKKGKEFIINYLKDMNCDFND